MERVPYVTKKERKETKNGDAKAHFLESDFIDSSCIVGVCSISHYNFPQFEMKIEREINVNVFICLHLKIYI